MKKLLTILFAAALLYSCGEGGGENNAAESTPADTASGTAATEPAAGGTPAIANERGLELIGASDCTTCHGIDKKVIGPSYVDVANKYENTPAVVDTLVSKIKKGGMGNWGNIAMTPHPDLPDEDAREMVRYILSLKTNK
jgi:cytochrome c